MIKVTISDVPGFTGEYEWDEEQGFTGHELHLIKKVAGVRLGEITEALGAGDYDVIVAVSAIAIWRSGRVTKDELPAVVDLLLDAEGGKILFGSEEEAEESPPEEAPPENGSSGADNVSSLSSSRGSSSTSAPLQENDPSRTGDPGSAIGAI